MTYLPLRRALTTVTVCALACLLAACAANSPIARLPRLDAPELLRFVQDMTCRLASPCSSFSVLLIDLPQPQAELFPDGRLALRIGLLRAIEEEGELAFVLAHEIAHRRLGHRPARSLDERLPLELEADRMALQYIVDLGYPQDSGHRLLSRLQPATTDPDVLPAARLQITQRLAALPAGPIRDAQPSERWARLTQPYQPAQR